MDREAWAAAVRGSQRVGHDWATELNWPVERVNWSCAPSFLQSNCWMLKAFAPRFFLPLAPYGALCMPVPSGRNRGGLGWEGTWGFGNELLWDCILHVLLAMAELSFQLAPMSTSLTMWHFHISEGGSYTRPPLLVAKSLSPAKVSIQGGGQGCLCALHHPSFPSLAAGSTCSLFPLINPGVLQACHPS